MNRAYALRIKINKKIKHKNTEEEAKERLNEYLVRINITIKKINKRLRDKLASFKGVRQLREETLNIRNVISVFESTLTRTLGLETNELSKDIMVVRTFFFNVLENIILDGFTLKGEKYVFFSASAGQIRTKKSVFIKENIWKKHQNTLMCGLTVNHINKLGGININKFLAYLSLCNSATEVWEEFNIDKAIVVNDFETNVFGAVDFINHKDYTITRKNMDVPIEHTDGCGMLIASKYKKNMMVRLPWIKGLCSPFFYDAFINKANENKEGMVYGKVTDIYGKEWDLLEDKIEVIFTKSQFKMHKYYCNELDEDNNVVKYGWDIYKENYKKYRCTASKCNVEVDVFKNARLNYQMIQTLTDISDKELEVLTGKTRQSITNIAKDKQTMLRVLGVTQANENKNYFQQALEVYPELLRDVYSKEILKQLRKSMVRNAKAGKISINGKYTFIIPDLYAFCENLILGIEKPKGLLADGEVYCRLYKDADKLDCLRSPHLSREHSVRQNVVDEKKSEWFITNGLYTSSYDLISKMLQFDNDGDTSLVVADRLFVKIAERNMKDIVPLYYEMATAKAEYITNENLYKGITTAYSGGNIGTVSNNITKIWNSQSVDLDTIKFLCMENNFIIDYAKTLYKPIRPKCKNALINGYTKSKVPYFFVYAKKKHKTQVEKENNSVVNRLGDLIVNPQSNFRSAGLSDFDYKMLMDKSRVDISTEQAKEIIDKYTELDLNKYFIINRDNDGENREIDESDKVGNIIYLYNDIKNKILDVNKDVKYVVDVLVEYLYEFKKSVYKTTLWECFGDIIVDNLKINIVMNQTYCIECGVVIERTSNRLKYCEECWKERERELWSKSKRKSRNVQV